MKRFGCLLLMITAACGGGTETGEAMLDGVMPPAMSATAKTFTGPDADGNEIMGWKIEFYEEAPGADCLEAKIVATIGIYTNQAKGSKPQALLQNGGIPIVTQSPPSLMASAVAANMSADNIATIQGQLTITEFHLVDVMHADRIAGSVSAGGAHGGTGEGVLLNGSFTAPICSEQ